MNRTANTRRADRGFTLIELCTSIGICAALLGQAVSAMTELRQQQRLIATSESLSTDLRLARSEAARSGEPVFFRVSSKGAQACYILHTGAKNDCDCADGQARCKSSVSQVIKAEWLSPQQPVRIQSNAETLQFQHRQGLVTQTGSIELALANGNTVRHVIAITGRARTCAVGSRMSGLPKCK